MAGYAKGRYSIAQCQRCGDRYKLAQLKSDGQFPGLLVCRICWSRKNEAEFPVDSSDATALYHPAPDVDAVASRALDDDTPIADLWFPGEPCFGGDT